MKATNGIWHVIKLYYFSKKYHFSSWSHIQVPFWEVIRYQYTKAFLKAAGLQVFKQNTTHLIWKEPIWKGQERNFFVFSSSLVPFLLNSSGQLKDRFFNIQLYWFELEFKFSIISMLLTNVGNILTSYVFSQFEFADFYFGCFSGQRSNTCEINGKIYEVSMA